MSNHLHKNILSYYSILLFSDNVIMEWSGQEGREFQGKKEGRFYLTTHRMIFNSKSSKDTLLSFSFPFITLSNVSTKNFFNDLNCLIISILLQNI